MDSANVIFWKTELQDGQDSLDLVCEVNGNVIGHFLFLFAAVHVCVTRERVCLSVERLVCSRLEDGVHCESTDKRCCYQRDH